MKCKTIGLKLATAVMTAAIAMQSPLTALQASAATAAKYLSEVILSYGNSDTEAKNWLKQNGYTVVDQNLNEGGYGGYEAMSWLGIASTRRSVYLGYKTTTDANEAITDMKIMNMNGGYSLQAYEQVLEQTKREKEHFLENLMAALKEYRANYKAGKVNAKIAHDALNKFKDDDSGQLMGDLLLNTLKTEDEAAWEADPTQHADMVTILMQGNSTCVSEIMQNLAIAQDSPDDSWLTRAIDKLNAANAAPAPEAPDADSAETNETEPAETDTAEPVYYENGLELMIAEMQEQYPTYNKQAITSMLMAEYDKDAKMMASSLIGLENYLTNYTKSGLSGKATQEEADAYFAENEFEDPSTWAGACALYEVLKDNWYGTTPLLNYLVYSDYNYLSDSAWLEGYADYSLPQRAMLYPLVAQMTEGQRSLLEYTAMNRMVSLGLMDADTWATTEATMQDPEYGATDLEVCSMYAEVNRDDFKVGEIAVTNMAQGKKASTGEAMENGLFGTGVSYLSAGIAIGGLAVGVAGMVIALKSMSVTPATSLTKVAEENIINAASEPLPVYEAALNGLVESPYAVTRQIVEYKNEMINQIELFAKNKITRAELGANIKALNTNYSSYLTIAGPNADVTFNAKCIFRKIDSDKFEMISYDGKIFGSDGSRSYDDSLNRYMEFRTKINPQIAEEAVEDLSEEAVQHAQKVLAGGTNSGGLLIYNVKDFDGLLDTWKAFGINVDDLSKGYITDLTDEQIRYIAKYLKDTDNVYGQTLYTEAELENLIKQRNIVKQAAEKQTVEQTHELVDQSDELFQQADDVMTAATGSSFWKWFGVGMAIFGLVMSAYGIYSMISDMKAYYHVEMLPIPRKMVDLGWQLDGSSCYIYYDCTKCNRAEVGMKNDTLGEYGDMNGDVMKEWLALYTTKDPRAGDPIKAGITVKKGTSTPPVNTVPLSFFGFESAVNMTDTAYTYNNDKNGIYLYYKTDIGAGYTGTVTTSNALVTTGVLSAIGGAGLCGLITALAGKRKKKSADTPTAT